MQSEKWLEREVLALRIINDGRKTETNRSFSWLLVLMSQVAQFLVDAITDEMVELFFTRSCWSIVNSIESHSWGNSVGLPKLSMCSWLINSLGVMQQHQWNGSDFPFVLWRNSCINNVFRTQISLRDYIMLKFQCNVFLPFKWF